MRLINARTMAMGEFFGTSVPQYAILSHTWGRDEVTFQDWKNLEAARLKAGFAKIKGACAQALEHGLEWVWVDTNCIDKSSSAELSEAINSMFAYYRDSVVCFAYLADVSIIGDPLSNITTTQIRASRWFTRGWTLQELLAPSRLIFYDDKWSIISPRDGQLDSLISEVTGIEEIHLRGNVSAEEPCIAVKMSWLSKRMTTRAEDMAYCMLGIFDINMPLLYGEGPKAFTRLQEEIIKTTNDHTIFCWTWTSSTPGNWTSLLAPSPDQFAASNIYSSRTRNEEEETSIFSMTNAGLSIRLPVLYCGSSCAVVLQAGPSRQGGHQHPRSQVYIPVCGKKHGEHLQVSRIAYPPSPVVFSKNWIGPLSSEQLLVKHRSSHKRAVSDMKPGLPQRTSSSLEFLFLLDFATEIFMKQWTIQPCGPVGPDVFDKFLSTFTVQVPMNKNPISAGVVLLPATRRVPLQTEGARAYIFLGVKVFQTHTQRFCQIFPWGQNKFMDAKRYQGAVDSLERQVLRINIAQEAYSCEPLEVSIIIDNPPHHSRANGNVCALHMSEGKRYEYQSVGKTSKGMRLGISADAAEREFADEIPAMKVHSGRATFRLPVVVPYNSWSEYRANPPEKRATEWLK